MNIFLAIILIITFIVCFIFYFYLKKSTSNVSRKEANSFLFKQQIEEIEMDFKRGLIAKEEYDLMKIEVSRRVLNYTREKNDNGKNLKRKANVYTILIILPILIFVTFISYLYKGNPKLPDLPFSQRINDQVPNIFYEIALKDINKKIEINSNNIDLYILKANTLSLLDKNNESLTLWKYIISSFEDDVTPEIYLSYGESLLQESLTTNDKIIISKEALIAFEKAIEKSNISNEVGAMALFYKGLYFYQNGNLLEAKVIWDNIIKSIPNEVIWAKNLKDQVEWFLTNKSQTFSDDKILSMVKALEERLYKTDSIDIFEWQKLGRSFLVLGEINKSVQAYNRAYLLDKDNLESLKGLAEAKLLNIDKNQSIDKDIIVLFNKILVNDPNNLLALWVISEEEIKLKNFKKAIILLNRLLLKLPIQSKEYNLVEDKLKSIKNEILKDK